MEKKMNEKKMNHRKAVETQVSDKHTAGMRLAYIDDNEYFATNLRQHILQYYGDQIAITMYDSPQDWKASGRQFDMYLVSQTHEREFAMIENSRKIILVDRQEAEHGNYMFRYQMLSNIVNKLVEENSRSCIAALTSTLKEDVTRLVDLSKVSDEQLKAQIGNLVQAKVEAGELDRNLGETYIQTIVQNVFSSIRGLGILDKLLADEDITEIMINDYAQIYVERAGKLSRYENGSFESREQLTDIIQKIVGKAGREVNQASPIVDARLEDGSRVNVTLPPIALNGPTMTIRRFSKEPMTMERLVSYGSITPEIAEQLRLLVQARYNIFISGGTGSGKTTFLNALSNFIPKDERLCTIEDSAELQIVGVENLIRMETRNANSSGSGEITMKDLIKTSLRMRPDRIIVGEVRGAEALDMLQAMNTGHDGSLSTGHANSSRDMLSRLETMVLQGAAGFPLEAIKQQIGSAVDIIIHLSRLRDHSRKVMEISEVVGYQNGEIILNPLYVFAEDERSTCEKVSGSLVRTTNPLVHVEKLHAAGIYQTI